MWEIPAGFPSAHSVTPGQGITNADPNTADEPIRYWVFLHECEVLAPGLWSPLRDALQHLFAALPSEALTGAY